MSKEIIQAVEVVSNEKEISREEVFAALEEALATAVARRKFSDDVGIEVTIDRSSGVQRAFQTWEVLDGDAEGVYMDYPDKQIWLIDAVEVEPDIKPGEYIRKEVEMVDGRIAAQVVMQTIKQKLRDSERNKLIAEYEGREGQLVNGLIRRNINGKLVVDMGSNVDAIVPKEHQIPHDPKRQGSRVRGLLLEIKTEGRSPQLILSRNSKEFLQQLFTLEVPEIGEGMIDILGVAREPGKRAKLAVRSNDSRLDPVGACVGIRGSRVQAVSDELAGEKIDIVIWDENEAQYVINALSPAEVTSIVVDEEEHSMNIAVRDDQLSKTIGTGGQNVRLASELTGWTLNVMGLDEFNTQTEKESQVQIKSFMEQLDVDEEVALILVQEKFSNIEEIAFAEKPDMEKIEEFDVGMVDELQNRAQDVLLTREIAREESIEKHAPSKELLELEGMDERTAYLLAGKSIITVDDLADQSVDEVLDISGIELDKEAIAALIMKAREPWFI